MAQRGKKDSKGDEGMRILRVTTAYHRACAGIQISILDMSKIVEVGLQAIDQGQDDEALGKTVLAFVNTIRKN